jgi:hypothetical protein
MLTDTAKITGWKWDAVNTYLEVFVRGTRVAYFDDATRDLTLLTNGLTVDSGGITITAGGLAVTAGVISVDDTTTSTSGTTGSVNTLGGLGVVKDAVVGGNVTVVDRLTYADRLFNTRCYTSTITTDTTVTQSKSGIVILCGTDSCEVALPAMSDGTLQGATYTVINIGTDDATEITISPGTADKIMGADIAGVDNKDLINTGATSKMGDMVTVQCDGTDGWFVTKMVGVWAAQA